MKDLENLTPLEREFLLPRLREIASAFSGKQMTEQMLEYFRNACEQLYRRMCASGIRPTFDYFDFRMLSEGHLVICPVQIIGHVIGDCSFI